MSTIDDLPTTTAIAAGDQLAIWSQSGGTTMAAAISVLQAYLAASTTAAAVMTKQFSAPSATGFSVAVTAGNTWLVLTPAANYAAGTIVLPSAPTDQQEVLVSCSKTVTTLTVSAANTIIGAPTTFAAAGGTFRLRFEAVLSIWYAVT